MNEAAIRALTALVNQPLPALVHEAVIGAIGDLEDEDRAERDRQQTLCQWSGITLTCNPPKYKCRWCGHNWYCHEEPPVCENRYGRSDNDPAPFDFGWVVS